MPNIRVHPWMSVLLCAVPDVKVDRLRLWIIALVSRLSGNAEEGRGGTGDAYPSTARNCAILSCDFVLRFCLAILSCDFVAWEIWWSRGESNP
jgi:hypothetical protein